MINKIAAVLLVATLIGAAVFLPAQSKLPKSLYCKSRTGDLFMVVDYIVDEDLVVDTECGRIFFKDSCLNEIITIGE